MLPKIETGDLLIIHDTGAHGFSMGYNYNGKLKSAELLLKEDGSVQMIRRAETPADYFATFDCFEIGEKTAEDGIKENPGGSFEPPGFSRLRMVGLEPTRDRSRKILSLNTRSSVPHPQGFIAEFIIMGINFDVNNKIYI